MYKNKDNDFGAIGSIYSNMLDSILVSEETVKSKQDIGKSELDIDGPETVDGVEDVKIDRRNKKIKDDNAYNVSNLSYCDCDEDEEGLNLDGEDDLSNLNDFKLIQMAHQEGIEELLVLDEEGGLINRDEIVDALNDPSNFRISESEEFKKEGGKIVRESLNNFMKRKSDFDKLFESVMYGDEVPGSDNNDELDALGIDDEVEDVDGGDDSVTLTLDRSVAQTLCDLLQGVLEVEDDLEDGDDLETEDDFGGDFEEDEESIQGTKESGNENYNDGKQNKVGDSNVKPSGGSASSDVTDKVTLDDGKAKDPNYGKQNKVGSLKTGKSMFSQ